MKDVSYNLIALQPLVDSTTKSVLGEVRSVLMENHHFEGINRKVQLKPLKWTHPGSSSGSGQKVVTQMLLIFKYGGVLTSVGKEQSDMLGKSFRQRLYSLEKLGVLSLHSTCSNDLKFYASDEGRVQMTAAWFARAFLDLDEEEVIPILFALVWNDKRSNMLLEHSSSDRFPWRFFFFSLSLKLCDGED